MKRLVLTISMVAALAACSRSSSTPAGVAEEFMRKIASGDCAGLGDYLSASSRSIAPKLEQGCTLQAAERKNGPDKDKTLSSVNVLEATENGDRATVRIEGVFSDGSKEGGETLTLVREEGRWRIDLLAGKSGGGGAGPVPTAPMTPPTAPMPTAPMAPTMDPAAPAAPTVAPPAAGAAPAPEGAEAPKPPAE